MYKANESAKPNLTIYKEKFKIDDPNSAAESQIKRRKYIQHGPIHDLTLITKTRTKIRNTGPRSGIDERSITCKYE